MFHWNFVRHDHFHDTGTTFDRRRLANRHRFPAVGSIAASDFFVGANASAFAATYQSGVLEIIQP